MQSIGEWGRGTDQDLWARTCRLAADKVIEQDEEAVIIIDDLRYLNELMHFRDGIHYRLNCDYETRANRSETAKINSSDSSEIGLDTYDKFRAEFNTAKLSADKVAHLILEDLF